MPSPSLKIGAHKGLNMCEGKAVYNLHTYPFISIAVSNTVIEYDFPVKASCSLQGLNEGLNGVCHCSDICHHLHRKPGTFCLALH